MAFLPNLLPSDNEKLSLALNPIPKQNICTDYYLYLPRSAFVVTPKALIKEFPNVNSLPAVDVHKSHKRYKYSTLFMSKCTFSGFTQLSSSFTCYLVLV